MKPVNMFLLAALCVMMSGVVLSQGQLGTPSRAQTENLVLPMTFTGNGAFAGICASVAVAPQIASNTNANAVVSRFCVLRKLLILFNLFNFTMTHFLSAASPLSARSSALVGSSSSIGPPSLSGVSTGTSM